MKYMLTNQESERLLFRKLEDEDFNEWLKFFKDPGSVKYLAFPKDKTPEELCELWFEKINNRYKNNLGGMNVLIEKETNKLVGQCGLLIQEIDGITELEIGYSLMPEFRGKGFAKEAAIKCRKFAFENNFADSLISIIHPDNKASIAVAAANNMKFDKTSTFFGMEVNIYRVLKCVTD